MAGDLQSELPVSHACAIECCPQEPVVRLSYTTGRTPRSYLLCEDHRGEAWAWVRSRFGDIPITEDTALQPSLFEVGRP